MSHDELLLASDNCMSYVGALVLSLVALCGLSDPGRLQKCGRYATTDVSLPELSTREESVKRSLAKVTSVS